MFHVKHVLADCISLTPPKCGQSSLIPSLVLSKVHPLRWAALWCRLRAGRGMESVVNAFS